MRDETRSETMRTLTSLTEIESLMADGPVYVRWSRGPEADAAMGGRSRDGVTGGSHVGLSAQELPEDAARMARTLVEYRFLRIKDAEIYGWLCRAKRVGTDSDGAASITPTEVLGRLSEDLVAACKRYADACYDKAVLRRRSEWPPVAEMVP